MTHMYTTDECDKCTYYSCFIQDANEWKCELCELVEKGIRDPVDSRNDIVWGRYYLYCGHQYHIRCLRRWCKEMGYIGCRICGPISEVEANQYCNRCDVFGHATMSCSK
jgi:hypothetical protein